MENKERKTAFNRKNAPIYDLKIHILHRCSKHVVKVEIWHFFEKKLKTLKPACFKALKAI